MENVQTAKRTLTYTLPRRLIATRREARLSQAELADRLGIDRSTIVRWESGKITPKRKDVSAWAMATGYDAEWLWTGEESDTPPTQPRRAIRCTEDRLMALVAA